MTPRATVETALRFGKVPQVPFTIYENLAPDCAAVRDLLKRGLGILVWSTPAVITRHPNVKVRKETWNESGKTFHRSTHETPVGTVSSVEEDANGMTWCHETLFKRPEDYKVLRFIADDARHEPNFEAYRKAEKEYGENGIFRPGLGDDPMQAIMIPPIMGMETFGEEWSENRDEILSLYASLTGAWRRLLRVTADAPGTCVHCNGNFVVDMLGPAGFEEYYMPRYLEAADILHPRGKLLGSHLDGNCRAIAPLVARSGLDYIEAFTPAPDTDMTLAEARKAWPDKALWINFPSSVHLKTDEEVERTAYHLLDEAVRPEGLIMAVTEDMPPHRWQDSCLAIMSGLERHRREKPGLYLAG